MRTLTSKERMLAAALGALIFLFANLFAVRWVAQQMRTARANIARLESENATVRQLLEEKPYWLARKAWLTEHPLEVFNHSTSGPKFTETVRAGIEAKGLAIQTFNLLPVETTGELATVPLELKLKGSLEAMTRWLYEVQQPGQALFLRRFELKRGEDGNTMDMDVVLGKVFTTSELAASP